MADTAGRLRGVQPFAVRPRLPLRSFDPIASADLHAGQLVLAYGSTLDIKSGRYVPPPTGSGLTAYGLDGASRFHIFGKAGVGSVQVAGGLAYAEVSGAGIEVFKLASGQVLRAVKLPATTELLIQPRR